jgi:hypothetical protein
VGEFHHRKKLNISEDVVLAVAKNLSGIANPNISHPTTSKESQVQHYGGKLPYTGGASIAVAGMTLDIPAIALIGAIVIIIGLILTIRSNWRRGKDLTEE